MYETSSGEIEAVMLDAQERKLHHTPSSAGVYILLTILAVAGQPKPSNAPKKNQTKELRKGLPTVKGKMVHNMPLIHRLRKKRILGSKWSERKPPSNIELEYAMTNTFCKCPYSSLEKTVSRGSECRPSWLGIMYPMAEGRVLWQI